MRRRKLVGIVLGLPLIATNLLWGAGPKIDVVKTPTCGCCSKWVDHLKTNGFTVTVRDVPSTAEYRRLNGVPDSLGSCHTATVGGYIIEGHVPAADIHRLLKEKPKATGLAVPGMPMGSPGMEGPRKDSYSTLLFHSNGRTSVFQRHSGD
jgi:hypothetical protein